MPHRPQGPAGEGWKDSLLQPEREGVASMKGGPCCTGRVGGSLSDQGPLPASPLLHSGQLHLLLGPSLATWLPNRRQTQYSTLRASLLAAPALGPSVRCCPKGQGKHREPPPPCGTQNSAQSQSLGLALPGLTPEQQVRHPAVSLQDPLTFGRPETSRADDPIYWTEES